jgi:predicted phosphodiesterase
MKTGKKILFIGDIHGLTEWEEITKQALINFYDIVFLGDYVDSFYVKTVEQLHNLKNICAFAKNNKKKVTLLLGNHDYAYIYNIDSISGKQYAHAFEYKKIFDDNKDLFQMAWGYTNPTTKKYTLATHAGITKNFYTFFLKPEIKEGESIHDLLNRLEGRQEIVWKVGSMRGGRGTPGPLWADYMELIDDPYPDINQVFGHTPNFPRLDHFGDDFIACIDSRGNRKVESMLITL